MKEILIINKNNIPENLNDIKNNKSDNDIFYVENEQTFIYNEFEKIDMSKVTIIMRFGKFSAFQKRMTEEDIPSSYTLGYLDVD